MQNLKNVPRVKKDKITKEQMFNHSIDKVWNAISKAEEISTWFISADFEAKAGYNYTFTASEDKGCLTIKGIVKTADPYKLVYTWIVQDTTTETTVSWELIEVDGGTKLILTHSGISEYPDEQMAINMFSSFSGGWDDCISSLEKHLS